MSSESPELVEPNGAATATAEAREAPEPVLPDIDSLPDGSGNDRDGDETDDERFDAG
ncbi:MULTISPECIES: hypothetical protein [Sinomonas]|jgi:hypothetical protein|uniref:hypothetical protein n=1 Tax=Sinomonas TaxID=596707 RepID=UPI001ABF38E2|nr:hypothetical protein [Sinomonas sp. R1AF57]